MAVGIKYRGENKTSHIQDVDRTGTKGISL